MHGMAAAAIASSRTKRRMAVMGHLRAGTEAAGLEMKR
jgi:hypothetical protein